MPGIRLLGMLPQEPVWLAFSGGVDSVAVWDFMRRGRTVKLAFFNHGTPNSQRAQEFIESDPQFRNCEIRIGRNHGDKSDEQSWEEFWRQQRYEFLNSLDGPVITAHHLDDCVETYVWRMCHGRSDTIPYQRGNVIRPFLATPKQSLVDWCIRNQLRWIEDTSNYDLSYTRNRVRHQIIPELLTINPGLRKVIYKLVTSQYHNGQKNE